MRSLAQPHFVIDSPLKPLASAHDLRMRSRSPLGANDFPPKIFGSIPLSHVG